MKAILVTGSREFDDIDMVEDAIREAAPASGQCRLVVGDCPTGADWLASGYWEARMMPKLGYHEPSVFKADWLTHGRAAGPLRNQRMVDHVTTNHKLDDITVLAFFKTGAGNRGTRNCVAAALAAGVPDQQVKRFWA